MAVATLLLAAPLWAQSSRQIESEQIGPGEIQGGDIADGTIMSEDIGDGEVASVDIEDGTITGTDIASETITNDNIDNGTILFADMFQAGIAHAVICGEATTINNNTVYYGPNLTWVTSSTGMTCDGNAAGNTTEATVDEPIYTNQGFFVRGMVCRNEADANADISFTLRDNAGATTPSVTCTIADNERNCVADVQSTTVIAAGSPVAIAAASTGNIADNNGFVCTLYVAY